MADGSGNTIKELRERRNALAKECRDLLDKNPGNEWKPETHGKDYDAKIADIGKIDEDISRRQKLLDLNAETAFKDKGGKVLDTAEDEQDPKVVGKRLFNKFLRGGLDSFTAEEAAAYRNTMSGNPDVNPDQGGYTVQKEVASELIKAMKQYGGMRDASTVFSTSQGNPLSWATMDDTGNTGELVAENQPAGSQDLAFSTVGLNVFKFSSKIVTVPWELAQDSEVDIEAEVLAALSVRLGRVTNTYFTTGTGTNQPRGIVTAASLGKTGTTGQTLTVIYDDLVDLQHSIDPAYRNLPGTGWMMHDTSVKVLRKIKDLNGRPIFVPGYEQGSPGGAPDEILGKPITVNQDIAVMAANAKSILFGNLKNYRIRDVMQATLFRFADSAYITKGQIGFLAWLRSGGNLLDVSGSTVKYYANSAT